MQYINEWYFPINFDSMPDIITLYHGTDYFALEEILESSVIDASSGIRKGETKGMNWFSTKFSTNYSRGFVFSFEIYKNEINKSTDGFKFMNNSEIANYEPISIQNRNFKICEGFDLKYEDLVRVWNIQLKKTNNNIEEAFFNFSDYFRKYYEDWDGDAYSKVIMQLMKQFNVIDELRNVNLIENKVIESPDNIDIYCNSPSDGHYRWDSQDSIAIIADPEITDVYIGEWSHMDIIYDEIYNGDEDEVDNNMDDKWLRKNSFHGRLWTEPKVISFWKQPSPQELQKIITLLKEKYSVFVNIDLMSYKIEISKNEFIPIKQYLNQKKNDDNGFDISTLHLMNGSDKSKTPQMQAYLQDRYKKIDDKLGKVSPAEYNYYKRYNMGENKINEVSTSDIKLDSFEPQDKLHPKLWINNKLNSRVRLRLMDIADDFIDTLAVNWVKPKDIVITGSLANYNWSRFSDIDVHIILYYEKVYKKKEFVKDYFNAKKEIWLDEHPNLKIYGYPVEMYVEDINESSNSSGVYSLNKNEWIKEPVNFQDVKLNERYIKKTAAKIMTDIDNIEKKLKSLNDEYQTEQYHNKLKKIFDKVKKIRTESLKKSGEMSSGNIIYKILRRCKYIDKIWDLINTSYDKIN